MSCCRSSVLLSIQAYCRLLGESLGIADQLAMPGVEDLDLPLPHHRELARPAGLS